jgi:TetR/AcrR family transcriptional repressor of nem operon
MFQKSSLHIMSKQDQHNSMSTKEEILKLASRELQEKGVNSLSFRELATALRIKSSSIHYHFPQKNDLIQTLMLNYSRVMISGLESIESTTKAGHMRLLTLVDMIGQSLEMRKCTAGVLATESALISDKAKQDVSIFFNMLLKWIEKELISMDKSKDQASVFASVILTSVEGSLMLDCFNKSTECLKQLRRYIELL